MIEKDKIIEEFSDLVTLPSIYLKVKSIMEDPDFSMIDLSNIISLDPGISSRLLKVVNSAFYGRPGHIDTVSRTVNILGSQQVHDLVLATSIARSFNQLSQAITDMESYWLKSIRSALTARELGRHCQIEEIERLFIQGLLRDVGHLVIYQKCPEQAEEIYINHTLTESDSKLARPVCLVEQEVLGTNFAELGTSLLELWQLPESLYLPISEQLSPEDGGVYRIESFIMHLCWAVIESGDLDTAVKWTARKTWNVLDLDFTTLEDIQQLVDQESADVFNLFFSNLKTAA